jgi:hypothetical protein
MSGVLRQTNDNLGSVTAAYDTAIKTLVTTMSGQNYNITFADVRGTNPGVNTTTDMTNQVNIQSPCQGGSGPLHPNNCGYLHYAQTIENAARAAGWKLFYPGLGISAGWFGNVRMQGLLSLYDGPWQVLHSAQQIPITMAGTYVRTNAASTIENTPAIIPAGTQFAPGICFYQDCSANVTAAGLTWDTLNSRLATGFESTFSIIGQHCDSAATNPTASCRTDFYTDPTSGAFTAPSGYVGPATAPTGACTVTNAWVFSGDGHISMCSAGTWSQKL